jgi:energy-coupling factor transporter ATP-binding protein EcfA2
MTIFDNMGFGLKMRKVAKRDIGLAVKKAADISRHTAFAQALPARAFGRPGQRVAVGRAIVRAPRVFLFDEPLSNSTPSFACRRASKLLKLHRQLQATCVYVTHDQMEAMTMADRIVISATAVFRGRRADGSLPKTAMYRRRLYWKSIDEFSGGTAYKESGRLFAKGNGFQLRLPDVIASSLESFGKADITSGIRSRTCYCIRRHRKRLPCMQW